MAKYKSPISVGHRKHIYMSSDDPRVNTEIKKERYRAKSGAKIIVVNNEQATGRGSAGLNLGEWTGGWYLRTVQPLVDYSPAIVSNNTNVFIGMDREIFLITTSKGYQIASVINYVDNVWKFYQTRFNGVIAFVESVQDFLEVYSFQENFIINAARFFPQIPYDHIGACGSGEGDLYVSMIDSSNTTVLKYAASGDVEWENTLNILGSEFACLDENNNFYNCSRLVDGLKVFSLDPDGNLRWAKEITGITNNIGPVVKILSSDAIHIVGHCGQVTPDLDTFVIKLDFDGNLVWAKTYQHTSECHVANASADSSSLMMVGQLINSETDTDGFVMKILRDGKILWARKMKSEQIPDVKLDFLNGCTLDDNSSLISGIILKDDGIPAEPSKRAFAASIKGAYPVGSYSLDGYYFSISKTEFITQDITPAVSDITPTISFSSNISVNQPDGIYTE